MQEFDQGCEKIGIELSEGERNAIFQLYKHKELANTIRYMDLIDEACGLVASSKLDGGAKEAVLNVDPEDELTEAEED